MPIQSFDEFLNEGKYPGHTGDVIYKKGQKVKVVKSKVQDVQHDWEFELEHLDQIGTVTATFGTGKK